MRGKTKKFFKIVWDLTLFVQNTRFSQLKWLASKSPKWVAKNPWTKFWKFCLKYFSWLGHPPASESRKLLRKLMTRASTCDKVWKMTKTQKFWKFSKCFSQLGYSLARESLKLLSKLATSLTSEWVAKNRVVKFFYFLKILKQNTFQKKTKNTQKSFSVWSTYDWVCTTHLIKYNHTNK